jgi:hypothetical protein
MNGKVESESKWEVLFVQMAADDTGRQQMADNLGIEVLALAKRIERLKKKHGLKSVAGIVALFFRNKLIE